MNKILKGQDSMVLPRRTIVQSIIADGPQTYTDGYGVTRTMYEPNIITGLRSLYHSINGDQTLSDEAYREKHGFSKPLAGAGLLDLLGPGEAAKLAELGETLLKGERAARQVKEAASLKRAQKTQDAISTATEAHVGKSGRVHFKKQTYGSGVYEPVRSSGNPVKIEKAAEAEDTKSVVESLQDELTNAIISRNEASVRGATTFSRALTNRIEEIKELLREHNWFKKQGGIISAKSGIHIKKANRGKFTDYCGGKVTQECIQRGKHSSNPAVRKRATFAANSRKWG